jgi:hypothetical protein
MYCMDLTKTFFSPARVMLIIGLDSAPLDQAKSYCPDAFASKSMMQQDRKSGLQQPWAEACLPLIHLVDKSATWQPAANPLQQPFQFVLGEFI